MLMNGNNGNGNFHNLWKIILQVWLASVPENYVEKQLNF